MQPNSNQTLQVVHCSGQIIHIVGCKETTTLFHEQMLNYHEFTHIDEPAKGVQLCVVIAITQPLLYEQGKNCTVLQGPRSRFNALMEYRSIVVQFHYFEKLLDEAPHTASRQQSYHPCNMFQTQ